MRTIYSFLLFFAVIALSSCSSSYRTGGTPDDVYYSPGQRAVNSNSNNGEFYNANSNDQYLMMKAQDPNRWSYFDAYDYGYSSAAYSPYSGFGYGMYGSYGYSPWLTFGYWNPYYSFFSSYYMWNSFYNPYYGGVIVVNTKYPVYNTYNSLHPFALTSYTNTSINNRNNPTSRFYTPAGSTLRNGGSFTRISQRNNYYNQNNLNRTNSNNNFRQSNFQQSTRSYTPSSFGGGGGRSFSRPGKG
jgi:hypothetical protein